MNSGAASYTNNYKEWGGRCPGQEPPAGTSPTTPTQVSVSPGVANVAATIYEPLLNVSTVTYKGSLHGSTSNVKPSDIEMKYASPAGVTPAVQRHVVGHALRRHGNHPAGHGLARLPRSAVRAVRHAHCLRRLHA